MADELVLQAIAARQHGLASRKQVARLGYTEWQVRRRLEQHLWRRAAPRILDVAPASHDPLRALHAVVLATGGHASHRSAAHLLGILDRQPSVPEIVVPAARTPKGVAAVVHRSIHLGREDRSVANGIPCTSPLRTLLDLGSVLDDEAMEEAVASAIRLGRTSARLLLRYVDRSLAGRPGAAALRTVTELYVDRTQETKSRLETIVDRAVRHDGIPRPVRQLRVRFPGRYFDLDLAWPRERVFIEADGLAHHASPKEILRDRERQNRLVIAGWLPLRYTWRIARREPARICAELLAALAGRQH